MRRFTTLVMCLLLVVPMVALGQSDRIDELEQRIEELEENEETAVTVDTPNLENFEISLIGRVHNDWTFVREDSQVERSIGTQEDSVDFTRARIGVKGTADDWINFKLEVDFANNNTNLKDAYLELTKLPGIGNLKVGHFYEPFGMERQTSTNEIVFMNIGADDFVGRNIGAMVHDTAGSLGWQLGYFKSTDSNGTLSNPGTGDPLARGDGNNIFTGRFYANPISTASQDAHVGLAYRYENGDVIEDGRDDGTLLTAKPKVDDVDPFAGIINPSGNPIGITASDLHSVGGEAAYQTGSTLLQGEYHYHQIDLDGANQTSDFETWYGSVSHVLTGESRPYSQSKGSFGGVNPDENFHPVDNADGGALEAGARFARTDLDDESLSGGQLDTWTAGLNFYPNSYSRVMLNYIYADRRGSNAGHANILASRFQLNF